MNYLHGDFCMLSEKSYKTSKTIFELNVLKKKFAKCDQNTHLRLGH